MLYSLVAHNPGLPRESVRKPDGSCYDMRDLIELNRPSTADATNSSKDSISWLTQPSDTRSYTRSPHPLPQLYFCESCLVVQSLPTRHCKLCDICCPKFDHHCIFINRCVGLRNHRTFLFFLCITVYGCLLFIFRALFFLMVSMERVRLHNERATAATGHTDSNMHISFVYMLCASKQHVRLVVLTVISFFTATMVSVLIGSQLRYISLGYTTQYGPPRLFYKFNRQMSTWTGALAFRMRHLYTFVFESLDENSRVYYKQQRDYFAAMLANADVDAATTALRKSSGSDACCKSKHHHSQHRTSLGVADSSKEDSFRDINLV